MDFRVTSQAQLDGMVALLSALRVASQDTRIPTEYTMEILDMAERLQRRLRDILATHYEGE